jgi:hypothetical protein
LNLKSDSYLIIRQKDKTILLTLLGWLLVFSAFVDATMYFFKEEGKLTNFSIIRIVAYIVLYVIYFRKHNEIYFSRTSKLILLFLFYTALLIPFSSTMKDSIESYLKVLLSMLMFIIGNNIITTIKDFRRIQNFMFGAALIICLQLIISNLFGLKAESLSSYNDELITAGGGVVDNAKTLCFVLLTFPIFFVESNTKKRKFVIAVMITLSIITFLLYFNRSAILGVLAGYLVILLYSKRKRKIYKIVFFLVIVTMIIVSLMGNIVSQLFTDRVSERDLYTEGRTEETAVVWETLIDKPVYEILFGKEIYNSDAIDFGGNLYHGRQLHVDYNSLLVGTGLVGLSIYILILLSICRETFKYGSSILQNTYFMTLRPIILAFVLASLIISYGGGIETVGFRSIFFLICGGSLGILRQLVKQDRIDGILLSQTNQ